MKISTKGRYALRMMVDLALYDNGDYISLRDVAGRQGISIKYMEQIISQLNKAGYLLSVRGPQGGYRLSRAAKDYTAGDILRVTEGSLTPVACLEDETHSCPHYEVCSTRDFWGDLYGNIQDYVNSVTLQDLVDRAKQRPGWDSEL